MPPKRKAGASGEDSPPGGKRKRQSSLESSKPRLNERKPIQPQSQTTGSTDTKLEEQSLLEGGPRVKFKCNYKGTLETLFEDEQELHAEFTKQVSLLKKAAWALEETGAAPVLPDGRVGGNAVAVLKIGNRHFLLVTKSGKVAKAPMDEKTDFCIVSAFDNVTWSADYYAASSATLPTSDTPLHHAALNAHKTLGWEAVPMASLHGHAWATEEEAEKLNIPISKEETLFSTPEDTGALVDLLTTHPYPGNKVYSRKGHGFVVLGSSVEDTEKTFRKKEKEASAKL